MRVVSTRVLPVPAPASTSTGPSVVSTASRCSGFRPFEIVAAAVVALPRGHGARGDAARLRAAGAASARFVEKGHVVGKAGHRAECSDSGRKGQKCLRFVPVWHRPDRRSDREQAGHPRRIGVEQEMFRSIAPRPRRGMRRAGISDSGGRWPLVRAGGRRRRLTCSACRMSFGIGSVRSRASRSATKRSLVAAGDVDVRPASARQRCFPSAPRAHPCDSRGR